jgi:hypothetical protein
MTKRERPILFSTEMVKAILEDRKTKTRRTNGLEEINSNPDNWVYNASGSRNGCFDFLTIDYPGGGFITKCPYGKVGDVLWVRETFARVPFSSYRQSNDVLQMPLDSDGWEVAVFKAGWTRSSPYRWKPCIHMPKAAARIWLEITDISVERLLDITDESAIAEGIQPLLMSRPQAALYGLQLYRDYLDRSEWIFNEGLRPTSSFISLWEKINGIGSSDADPFVWVISFKVLSTTGRPTELDVKEVAHA